MLDVDGPFGINARANGYAEFSGLTFNEYQTSAAKTAVYPGTGELFGLMYCALGAAGEAGEVANKVKKIARDSGGMLSNQTRAKISQEIGGVLWYLAMLSKEIGVPLGSIAQENLNILASRKERGVIHGSGDNR